MVNRIETRDITSSNKCDQCNALCCSYITQELDTPRSMQAFDVLLWQVAHKGVHIFKDGNGWYLLCQTCCEFLLPDYRCGIYERRPIICREHSNDACEFDAPINDGCELYFQTYGELDNYCRQRFKGWDKRLEKFETERAKKKL
ncbi:YkgJ family cysteine cluster protein [Endozoicomonas sp. SESOKO1]|uniref:YkgJ family cysteine cluster protein n=1 Tax=Endozoicomonas sp. SESOKO1 TaxID=2828742 RepID=UPI0021481E27|nr:YkgJ family cysteine cluster protein [Endozoicomonas sp. SESOKO1]